MLIWRSFSEARDKIKDSTAVSIGSYDGVHLGHQTVLLELNRLGQEHSLLTVVITFDEHPSVTVGHETSQLLIPLAYRLRLLAEIGIGAALVLPFDNNLAALESEAFVGRLCGDLRMRHIVVGYDFRFGAGGLGDAALLERLGAKQGFGVTQIPPVSLGATVVSSTAIRWMLIAGDVKAAERFLGRPFTVRGKVVHGEKIGRNLGFPTANIKLPPGAFWPRYGVYLVKASLEDGICVYGVANVGVKPTFGKNDPVIEVYILSYKGDLYNSEIDLGFLAFIRPERRFTDPMSLREQIYDDIRRAEELMADNA